MKISAKKSIIFSILTMIAISFFACDLEIPKAIQIKGTPEIRFGADLDIGKNLSDMMDKYFIDAGSEKISFINCENTDIKTFIIHMNLFEDSISLPAGFDAIVSMIPPGSTHKVPSDMPLPGNSSGSVSVPAIDFEFLNDFSFTPADARIYISGSDVIKLLTIEIKINNGSPVYLSANSRSNLPAGGYTGTKLPDHGASIVFPFNGESIDIQYRIFIKAGTVIPAGINISNPNVFLEAAVMVPLELTAGSGGALFKFPELFPADQDLFGRKNEGDENPISEFVEDLSLDIKFNRIPFNNATLFVKSKGVEINSDFSGNSLFFEISETRMNDINNNWPFVPEISLQFAPGGKLSIPREFKATEFAFKAKLDYRMEL